MATFPDVPPSAVDHRDDVLSALSRGLGRAGGRELVYQVRQIGRAGLTWFWLDQGPLEDYELEDSIGGAVMHGQTELRRAVVEADGRVPYTMTFRVTSTGERSLELDTETKLGGVRLNSEQVYLEDLAAFPRDGDDVPVWMRPVLARWGAWDPEAGRLTVDDLHRPDGTPTDMPDVEVDYWLEFKETPEGPRRGRGYGAGNVGPDHTVTSPEELAAWRRANT